MAIRTVLLFLSTILSGLSVSGCSSLLYHPTQITYFSPERFDLKPEELWIGPLHAWRFHSQLPGSRGLVVLFHGNAENLTSHFSSLAWLPPRGWDTLIFDYRGFGKSPGEPTPQSTVEDGHRVLEWALKQQVPLILMGQSIGGAVLLRVLEEVGPKLSPNALSRVKLVALESTFRSYREAGQLLLSNSWITSPFQWLPKILLSDEFAARGQWPQAFSWWVIHGSEDRTIDPVLGRRLFDLLPHPKRWILTAGGGHIDAFWIEDPRGGHPYREAFLAAAERAVNLPEPRSEPDLTLELPFDAPGVRVLQGPGGSFSHQGENFQAVDFELPEGTPVKAMRGGKVIQVIHEFGKGAPSPELVDRANRVLVEHSDGTIGEYFHLAEGSAVVHEGQQIRSGDLLALSGNSGFSTEPHLHVRVYTLRGSVPMIFRWKNEAGRVLKTGDRVRTN